MQEAESWVCHMHSSTQRLDKAKTVVNAASTTYRACYTTSVALHNGDKPHVQQAKE